MGWIDPLGLKSGNKNCCDVEVKCEATISSFDARRKALKLDKAIVRTSTPVATRGVKGWEQYLYKVGQNSKDPNSYRIISHHQKDTEHPCPHWHIGTPKYLNSTGSKYEKSSY